MCEIIYDISREHKMGKTAKLKALYYSCDLARGKGRFNLTN
jgi:hypothetical protein